MNLLKLLKFSPSSHIYIFLEICLALSYLPFYPVLLGLNFNPEISVGFSLSWQIITQKGTKPPIVVVGNKTDLDECERQVEYEVTEMVVCEDWRCGYIECSAKDNTGIVQIFKELLVQANIRYNLSPAVRRRRQSLPSFTSAKGSKSPSHRGAFKRHSCTMT